MFGFPAPGSGPGPPRGADGSFHPRQSRRPYVGANMSPLSESADRHSSGDDLLDALRRFYRDSVAPNEPSAADAETTLFNSKDC
jgi:hypothetical protein